MVQVIHLQRTWYLRRLGVFGCSQPSLWKRKETLLGDEEDSVTPVENIMDPPRFLSGYPSIRTVFAYTSS